jgi:aspartyl-tRNA(Asn)/glutamyl-tRNA(Gln) amidotransferase subunit A
MLSLSGITTSSVPQPYPSMPITSLNTHNRRELMQASLAIARDSSSVFTHLYVDAALAAAAHADVLRVTGQHSSALAGLSVSVKDLFDVAGETTLAGSIALRDAPPAASDAVVVARLRAAGAAIIGKTNMTEFAYSGVGINPHHGTPANPADPTRIPGGSSSGAAVSVAIGSCVAAIGSDTGGSVRIPAALCGLVGFKPTMRRVPVRGALPLAPSLDSVGPIAATVDDCLLIDRVIADDPLDLPAVELAQLKLAIPEDVVLDAVDSQVAKAFTATVSRLSAAGAQIVEVPMRMLAEAKDLYLISPYEAYPFHESLLSQRKHEYDPRVVSRILLGADATDEDRDRLRRARESWRKGLEDLLGGYDAMIMPTVPIVAPKTEALLASDDAFFDANRLLLRNTSIVNLLDGCAISLPCHREGDLPVGFSLASSAMKDARIASIARLMEALLAPSRLG